MNAHSLSRGTEIRLSPMPRPRARWAHSATRSPRWVPTVIAAVWIGLSPMASAQTVLYHSPADDGAAATEPALVPAGSSASLYLYWASGPAASSAAEEVCSAGDGDEICAGQIELRAEGSFSIDAFTPDAAANIVFAASPTSLSINVLDPIGPTPGVKRLGQLDVTTDLSTDCTATACEVVVDQFDVVEADLAIAAGSFTTPTSAIAVPEPGLPLAFGFGVALLSLLARRRRHGVRNIVATTFIASSATLIAVTPAEAQLEVLEDAHYITRCAGSERDLPVANTSFCDRPRAYAWTGPQGVSMASGEAVVSAEAFSSRPRIPKGIPEELALRLQPLLAEPFVAIAFVQASATYETSGPFNPPPGGTGFNSIAIDGTAAVEATFTVRQKATPPIATTVVPLRLRVLGEMTINGVGNTQGTFRVTVNGDVDNAFEFIQSATGFYSVNSEFPGEIFEIEVGQTFIKLVQCSAEARWPGVPGFCSAVLDPIIELDQETTDALLGPNTFPLADYFEIEYSENFLTDAPANICGDVTLDEFVLESDLDLLRQSFIGQASLSADALDRCATRAESTGCDLADAVVLARTVQGGAAPRAPGIAPACAAVTSP